MKIFFYIFLVFINLYASNLDEVKNALKKEFQNNFPKINIINIDLKINSLPKGFENFQFLRLANGKFNQASGFLRAEFKTPKNIQKNVFFRYFIHANLEVFKSTKNIQKGEKLGIDDYKIVFMDFAKIPPNALNETNNLIAKANIKKNTILKENMFKIIALIKKNESVQGILKDNGVSILVELISLESANLGEKIRLKNKEGKFMQGVVVGKNKVLLQ